MELFFILSRETSSRKYDIDDDADDDADDDDDDDDYDDDDDDDDDDTSRTRTQSTCEDYIPSARRRKKKKETERGNKINLYGPELKEKKEKERKRKDEIEGKKRGWRVWFRDNKNARNRDIRTNCHDITLISSSAHATAPPSPQASQP